MKGRIVKNADEPTYTVEIRTDNFMGVETEVVRGVRGDDVQAVKDGAKFTSGIGDTLTFKVTEER